jgi:glutamine amidotransferase
MSMPLFQKPNVSIPALPICNVGAVANMVRKCGGVPHIIQNPDDLISAEHVIIAGVGAFDAGMRALKSGGWISPLQEIVENGKIPILGICLGMQLMCRQSEEGATSGLAWFEADVRRLDTQNQMLKVPHMGWNTINIVNPNVLISELSEEQRFYFVHSYHVVCDYSHNISATTNFGIDITAAINRNQIYGTQFHPEKSHRFGMRVIKQFLTL